MHNPTYVCVVLRDTKTRSFFNWPNNDYIRHVVKGHIGGEKAMIKDFFKLNCYIKS